jgi:GNAT superfamily N-acetyltransferase
MPFTVRSATAADYANFARLFPELRVSDPLPSAAQFAERILPRAVILEEGGEAIGYAFWHYYGRTAHVVNVVVDPRAQGRGAGLALMKEARARVSAAGCTRWYLNVKQDNAPAIRLYERSGMTIEHEAWAVDVAWERFAALPKGEGPHTLFVPSAADDAEIAERLRVDSERIAALRARPGNVLLALREGGVVVAFGVLDPAFPILYPVRAARVELASPLLDAFRPHSRHERVHVYVEANRALYDALRAVGAELRYELYRMSASL